MPSGSIQSLVGPAPGAEGDALNGRTLWHDWGALSFTQIEIMQPIYTFGALSSARKAARAGTEAESQLLKREEWALRTQIAEYYYGYQFAFEASELAEGILEDLNKALVKAEKKSSTDADKLRIFIAEAKARMSEADKGMNQARLGMAWRTGRLGHETPRWDKANLVARDFKLQELAAYQAMATESRPELTALAKDVEARQALADVEAGLRLPSLFAAGRFVYTVAPKRPDLETPFAFDPANQLTGAGGVGIRWDLGYFEKSAKLGQARAEALQAQARATHFGAGIRAEVEKNYLDVKQASEAKDIREDGAKAAKRVFRDLLAGYLLGTHSDSKGLMEALGQHVLAEKARLESIYGFDVATVKLEQAVGREL